MRCLAFALLICGTAAAQTAAMYRTVSPDGTVTFSDVPLSENSEIITVLVRSGTTRTAASANQETVNADESIAAEIAENCDRAREQERTLANSTRLYRVLPSGERQFLSDEEIVEAREQAAADVAQWCQQSG